MSSVVFRLESGEDLKNRISSIGTLYHDAKGNLLSRDATVKKYSRQSTQRRSKSQSKNPSERTKRSKSQSYPLDRRSGRSKSKSYSVDINAKDPEIKKQKCVTFKEKYNRKNLINEILEMEKTKREIEESRKNMALERIDLYNKYKEISNRQLLALKINCQIKKKSINRTFDKEIDQFLFFRNGKNKNKLEDQLGLQNLQSEFHKSLIKSLNDIKNMNKYETKNISISNKEKIFKLENMSQNEIGRKRLYLQDRSYRVGNRARNSFLVEKQLMEKIKHNEDVFKNDLGNKITRLDLTKKLDLAQNCLKNLKDFQKTLELYRNVYKSNFNQILMLSSEVNMLKKEERRKKKKLHKIMHEFDDMNKKYSKYKSNIWDLKRFVNSAPKLRKQLLDEMSRQKTLKVQKQVEIVKKDLLDRKLDVLDTKFRILNEQTHQDFLNMKKRFYKRLVKGAEMLKSSFLRDYYFKEVLEEKYNVLFERDAAKSSTFADYENSVRMTVKNEPPDRISFDFNQFEAVLTLRYLEHKIKENSLHSTDLGLDSELLNNFLRRNTKIKSETCL